MKTGLLVSVRDAAEALDALAAGADLIDLKEPRHGSLGAVEAKVMREVVATVAERVPVSAALGELLDEPPVGHVPLGIQLIKLGLAGCAAHADWPDRFASAVQGLPERTRAVAVAYVDWNRAAAPAPERVLEGAVALGCQAVLVDTWKKDAGGLLDLWTLAECERFVARVRGAGLMAVIGGSLTAEGLQQLLPIGADYLAVRGAACAENRTGRLSAERVRELASIVHEPVIAAGGARPHVGAGPTRA